MSFVVLANSSRVILPLQTRMQTPESLPLLTGILISQAKESGHCSQSYIEINESGIPRPYRGERWCYEWRSDGDNLLACWLGFPNVFFSGGIDPNVRIGIDALGRYGTSKGAVQSLSRISITIKTGGINPGPRDAVWLPDEQPKLFV